GSLGFHPAYLVPVIGAGSLMGSWMNDSGFWVFAKMGGLTEGETLRSWTVLLSILSLTGFVVTLCMALAWPSLGA
ncbi:MAG: gluconate permease, partial [Planctomycetota bacterium]